MHIARIAELLDPYIGPPNDQRLTTNDLERISTYIDILQRWNARINLTAIRNEEEIVTRHFGESFFLAAHLFPLRSSAATALKEPLGTSREEMTSSRPARSHHDLDQIHNRAHNRADNRGRAALQGPREAPERKQGALAPAVADVGSGPGFPGIPLKLWAPEIRLTLIESNHKKSTFLREIARALILTDINIQTTRAETLAEKTPERFDVVTLRAVERFETILPIAASLLAPTSRMALLIGNAQVLQARTTLPTLTWSDPIPIPNSQSRVIFVGSQDVLP